MRHHKIPPLSPLPVTRQTLKRNGFRPGLWMRLFVGVVFILFLSPLENSATEIVVGVATSLQLLECRGSLQAVELGGRRDQ